MRLVAMVGAEMGGGGRMIDKILQIPVEIGLIDMGGRCRPPYSTHVIRRVNVLSGP